MSRRHSPPPQAGGAPSYVRTFSGWVYVAFVTDVYSRRIIGWQTTYRPVCTDLALDTLEIAFWQRKRQRADLSGLVYHLRPRGAVQVHPLRGRPGRVRGGRLCRLQGRPPFGFALTEALNSLYKAELILWPSALAEHRRRPCSPPPSGSTGRAPSALTPPSGCVPPPSTKSPGHPTPTTTTAARDNHKRQPPAPDKPASTKPGA